MGTKSFSCLPSCFLSTFPPTPLLLPPPSLSGAATYFLSHKVPSLQEVFLNRARASRSPACFLCIGMSTVLEHVFVASAMRRLITSQKNENSKECIRDMFNPADRWLLSRGPCLLARPPLACSVRTEGPARVPLILARRRSR